MPEQMTGSELRALRESLEMSVEELAAALDWGKRTVENYEYGTQPIPPAKANHARMLVAFRKLDESAKLATNALTKIAGFCDAALLERLDLKRAVRSIDRTAREVIGEPELPEGD